MIVSLTPLTKIFALDWLEMKILLATSNLLNLFLNFLWTCPFFFCLHVLFLNSSSIVQFATYVRISLFSVKIHPSYWSRLTIECIKAVIRNRGIGPKSPIHADQLCGYDHSYCGYYHLFEIGSFLTLFRPAWARHLFRSRALHNRLACRCARPQPTNAANAQLFGCNVLTHRPASACTSPPLLTAAACIRRRCLVCTGERTFLCALAPTAPAISRSSLS